jgi:hypothetical protein
LALLAAPVSPAAAQSPANADDIVITAQRSGIPVWRVRGSAGTLVLVGTIEEVAKGTDWKPESLEAALREADQVMFPADVQYTGGFFAVMGVAGKARKMEHLPKGDTLANYLSAAQMTRLAALRDRGLLKPGFETRRPIFAAYDLIESAKGERSSGGFLSISRVDWKSDPEAFVRNGVHKYRLRLVPMRKASLNGTLAQLASTPPAAQVPCLLAAAAAAEAGPAAFHARSQAWVRKRVADVLAAPSEKAFTTCASVVRSGPSPAEIESSLTSALRQPLTTIAVLELSSLAAPSAMLDRLAAAGFEIIGPPWK